MSKQQQKQKRTTKITILLTTCYASINTANAFSTTPTLQTSIATTDTTKVGTLTVPQIGCGTIAWSDNGDDNSELKELISTTSQHGGAFFDTGERYGSHSKLYLD